jgi:hypothetical protein
MKGLKRLQFMKYLDVEVKKKKLGESLTGLKIPLVEIYYRNKLNLSASRSKVLIIARCHPGESLSSVLM